jgi:hypothetical protein
VIALVLPIVAGALLWPWWTVLACASLAFIGFFSTNGQRMRWARSSFGRWDASPANPAKPANGWMLAGVGLAETATLAGVVSSAVHLGAAHGRRRAHSWHQFPGIAAGCPSHLGSGRKSAHPSVFFEYAHDAPGHRGVAERAGARLIDRSEVATGV